MSRTSRPLWHDQEFSLTEGIGEPKRPVPWLRVNILGPLEIVLDGRPVVIASLRQRALLVLLAMEAGRVVPLDRLIDRLWDGAPPPQGAVTLRSYVSNVRQALGGPSGAAGVLETRGAGYVLELPDEALDAVRLRRLVEQGQDQLRHRNPAEALTTLDEAVGLWRGQPLAEVADHESARSTVAALTELYLGAVEARFEALLATGRHLAALPDLEAFAADHPLRETPRAQQMLALYRAGRTPEGLEVHRSFRRLLRDELGLDPSPRLQSLLQDMLEQAPALASPTLALGPPEAVPAASPVAATNGLRAPKETRPAPGAQLSEPRRVVGREREVRTLIRHLDRLQSRGTGAVVLLGGEPGIGKTTLLELLEAEALARGIAVFLGRSPAATGAPSLWPWTQVVEAVAARLDDEALQAACSGAARLVLHLSSALAGRAGQPSPITGDNAQTMRFLLYEAVSVFLRQGSAGPTLLLLDDLHWADPPSLELLSYLTPSLAARELLVVAAFRDLPAERTPELDATLATMSREDTVDEVVLRGLDINGVAQMLSNLKPEAPNGPLTDEALVSLLHDRTGGNPFFVRQLGRLLLKRDAEGESALPATVPSGVRHIISSRLRELSEQATLLLEAAAVLGREFDLPVAAAVAAMSVENALDACDEASRHGLLDSHADAGHRFVHALVQEAVVESLPPGRAARLHAAALSELERVGAPVDRLADHSWRARDLAGSRGVPHHRAAARSAMSVFAYERAELYLRRALDLVRRSTPPDPHTELTVLLSLFQLIATNRGWGANEAREVVARARALAAAGALHPDSVRLWWSLWLYLLDRDDAESGAEVATTLQQLVVNPDEGVAAVVAHHTAVFSRLDDGRLDVARDELRAARAAMDRTPNRELAAFDEHLGVMVLMSEGYFAALDGDSTGHRAAAESAIALADADGRPFPRAIARTLAATSAVFLPDAGYVQQRAAEALELSTRFGFGWLESSARCAAACADARLGGDTAAATRQISDILTQHRDTGRVGTLSAVLVMLAEVHRAAGRLDEARVCLHQARAQLGPHRGLMDDHLRRRLLDLR